MHPQNSLHTAQHLCIERTSEKRDYDPNYTGTLRNHAAGDRVRFVIKLSNGFQHLLAGGRPYSRVIIYDTRNGPNTHSSNPRYIMDC